MTKVWYFSRLFWIGAVGFIGYGSDFVLSFMQEHVMSGCAKRSLISSITFAAVTYLRLKTNTSIVSKKEVLCPHF
jgi:hypothetical protein